MRDLWGGMACVPVLGKRLGGKGRDQCVGNGHSESDKFHARKFLPAKMNQKLKDA